MRPRLVVRLASAALLSLTLPGCPWASAPGPEDVERAESALAAACTHPEREELRRAFEARCQEQAIACDGSASAPCARIAGICNRGLRACPEAKP
jgi:hypothetical protein